MNDLTLWLQGFELFNAGAYEAWVELWTHDCEWQPALVGGVEGPDSVFVGHQGLLRYLDQVEADWDELQMDADRFEERRNGVVLITGRAVGRGRQSGAGVEQPAGWALQLTPAGLARRMYSSFDLDAVRRKVEEWERELPAPALMGVVNVTPDSFSDGGDFFQTDVAIAHGQRLVRDGAHIVDIGGESTRPGSEPVPPEEELERVLPVVSALGGQRVSIDTTKLEVARSCVDAGATIVNDVSAFRFDPDLAGFVADAGVDCCLMHMLGEPRTMQKNPRYDEVVSDVKAFLEERLAFAVSQGIAEERVWLDPGIGFGKTLEHNLELLRRLDEIVAIGRPVVIGTSRKSFLGRLTGGDEKHRLPGTIATNVLALERGARVFRVHDVAPVADALTVAAATLRRT